MEKLDIKVWAEFLKARSKAIKYFHSEGKSIEEICHILNLDHVQCMMILFSRSYEKEE